jgi:hypothetical protein
MLTKICYRWTTSGFIEPGDDALTERGYCIQHGVGTRRNEGAAERTYRAAIASMWITDYAREEAMYHLGVLLLSRQSASSPREAVTLLRAANVDKDYPQAETLLRTIGSADAPSICICRRHLRPRLAKRHCPLHGPKKGQQISSDKAGETRSGPLRGSRMSAPYLPPRRRKVGREVR